ncbi:MAG TPA: ATP-binding protein [Polyangium sp.]|nr:ATP-binding protein [Polyangium sp.]
MNNQTLRAALANIQLSESSAASLAGFLDEYFGVSHDTPFGGRERELQALDEWLNHPTHSFALVVSEAGRGKSALLTQWAARIAARQIRVAFAPISIRFGTSLRGAALRLLAQELASLTGRKLSEARHVEALRADCEAMLSAPHDAPLVIVIDGVDEATGWQLGEDLTLSSANTHCKILLSARSTPTLDSNAWRQKLGLDPNSTSLFSIKGLSQEAVHSLLAEIEPTQRADLSAAIYRLSQGDPLLVRLYLESLRTSAHTRDNLPQTPPGLEGWFSSWWSQLCGRWMGNPVMQPLADDIFDILAASLGPIPRKTLLALLRPQDKGDDLDTRVNILLQDIRPLLLGDGERIPFVLSHPRLRYFRLEQMSQDKRDLLNQRFVTAGEAELAALRESRILPADASSYLVRYLGAHVETGPLPFDKLETLVCPAWQAAWEALEGTYDGFLEDVDRAWKYAETSARSDISRQTLALTVATRCALVFSSVSSLVYSLPPNLAGHLVEQGIWSPAVALSQSRWPSGGYRSETLVSLAPWLDLPLLRRALMEAARTQYMTDLNQVEGISALLARMVLLGASPEIPRFVEVFPLEVRALIGAVSWKHLPKELHAIAAQWVAQGARKVSHCSYAAATVFAALPILAEPERTQLIQAAIDRLWDEEFGLDTEHAAFLGAAGEWSYGWKEAKKETMAYPAMSMFAAIAPYLPEDKKAEAYDKWFVAAQKILTENFSLLSMAIPRGLTGERLAKVLTLVRSRTNDHGKAKPLVVLCYEYPELRPEALAAVEKLGGAHGAFARMSLAAVMDPGTADRLATEAYRLILSEIDKGKDNDLWNADQHWPREPGFMHWCYIGANRYGPVLLVECLRWMHPPEKARCVRELLARFRRIADNDAILATAATLAHEMPTETHAHWAKALSARRRGETNAITLVSLANLMTGEERHAMAIEAWNGSIATDTERLAGAALARATKWLTEEEREPIQIAAIQRWTSGPRFSNASSLSGALCGALTLGAARSWLEKDSNGWVLESLIPTISKQEQTRVKEHLMRHVRSLHQHAGTLRDLYRHVENSGDIIAEYLTEDRSWGYFREERNIAISLGPLYASGHIALAEELRKNLQEDFAQRIAKMAYSLYKKEGQRQALQEALAPLEGNQYELSLVYDLAIEMFGPLGYLPEILAQARTSDHLWLGAMRSLQEHGYTEVLQEELTAERIERHRTVIFQRIDGSFWIKKANATTLVECWLDYWRSVRMLPRRQALAGYGDRWFYELSSLISTLSGQEATEAMLHEVLQIGEWFA